MNRLEPLSPALLEIVRRLEETSAELVVATRDAVLAEVPAYREISDPATLAHVNAVIVENVRLWYGLLIDGRFPDDADLERLGEFARVRARQGFALDAMLHAFRVGGIVFWRTMLDGAREAPEARDEVLFVVAEYLFRYVDVVSRHASLAYVEEAGKEDRRRSRAEHELTEAIFGADDEERFRGCALALGLDPAGPVRALAARPAVGPGAAPEADAGLATRLIAIASARADASFGTARAGHAIVWVPCATTAPPPRQGETALCQRLEASSAWRVVGLGAPAAGQSGWRATAEQAVRAAEIGPRLAPARNCHHYVDVALFDVALRTPELSDLLRTVVERLGSDSDLLRTLTVYFDNGRHAKVTAATLSVHPNTLAYRLRRVEKLLEASFDDHEWVLRLQLALKLQAAAA